MQISKAADQQKSAIRNIPKVAINSSNYYRVNGYHKIVKISSEGHIKLWNTFTVRAP